MKKHYALLIGLLGMVSTMFAQTYDVNDSTAIQAIRTNNFTTTTALNWTDPDPGNWIGVVWDTTVSPRRVKQLLLGNGTSSGGATWSGYGQNWSCGMQFSDTIILFDPSSMVTTNLKGNLDLSPFSELEFIHFSYNNRLQSVNFSGLNNLLQFRAGGCDSITSIDVAGLASLQAFHMNNADSLKTINASNCPNLTRVKMSWGSVAIENVDFTGCSSLEKLNLMYGNNMDVVDLTGISSLQRFAISRNTGTISSIINLGANTNMRKLSLARNNVSNGLDVSMMDSICRIGFKENEIDMATGIDSSKVNLEKFGAENNRLTLSNAVDIAYHTILGNQVLNATPHVNDGTTILYTDSLDYSAYASIDVQGVAATTTFNIYGHTGGFISTNNTGIFNFVITDTADTYYVEMINSSVTVTTDTIWVVGSAAGIMTSIDVANFGDVEVGTSKSQTLTVENFGNADLNVSNITMPTGFSISATTATIAAGGSQNFTVNFSPTDSSVAYGGDVVVSSNSTLAGSTNSVYVMGNGIITPPEDTTNSVSENVKVFKFYPNPTEDILTIDGNTKYINLDIYTIKGELVKTVNVAPNGVVDVRELESGTYFIRSSNGEINEKVIKK